MTICPIRLANHAHPLSGLGLLILLTACAPSSQHPLPPEDKTWELVWQDEFDSAELDKQKWAFEVGNGQDGWGNQELQYYTSRVENATIQNSALVITARQETYRGFGYTSARLVTRGLFSQTYGRFEARIRLPQGQGIWPAFWLLGDDIASSGWPGCGEIDIMEYRGQESWVVHGSLHGPGYHSGRALSEAYVLSGTDSFVDDFHLFAIEWGPDSIVWSVDSSVYQTLRPADLPGKWVFDHPFFIILNVAVGGNYVGRPDATTSFPQPMVIDFIRVYQQL